MPTILPPTGFERALRALSYLAIASISVAIAVQVATAAPAMLLSHQLGVALTAAWVLCMAMAFPASVAAARGRYRVEFIAIPWFGVALILGDISAWVHAFSDPNRIGTAAITACVIFQLAARYRVLMKLVRARKRGGDEQ